MSNLFSIAFVMAAVAAGAPLLFGTLGEILTEKSGNLNLGVEGMMYMGGVAGLAGAYYYEQMAGPAASGVTAAEAASSGRSDRLERFQASRHWFRATRNSHRRSWSGEAKDGAR